MSKCPLGDECDLTVAWMAGQEEARDSFRARINQLEVQLGLAITDANAQRARAEAIEAQYAAIKAETLEQAAELVDCFPGCDDAADAIRAIKPAP